MKKQLIIAAIFSVLAFMFAIGSSSGQNQNTTSDDPYSPAAKQSGLTQASPPSDSSRADAAINLIHDAISLGRFEDAMQASRNWKTAQATASNEIGQVMHELRNTEDSAKKAELMKKLETAITKAFDEDLQRR